MTLNIDRGLLEAQQGYLAIAIENATSADERDALEGILGLLNAVADGADTSQITEYLHPRQIPVGTTVILAEGQKFHVCAVTHQRSVYAFALMAADSGTMSCVMVDSGALVQVQR